MNNKKFLKDLKQGFCPWQTMPFCTANMYGTPEKGIFLVFTKDYPSFGNGCGAKITRCNPEDFDKVVPAIKKVFDTFDSGPFTEVEDYFKPVNTVEESFILPDGEPVVPGDYIEICWQPHYADQPMSKIMIVGPIYDEDCFQDVDQFYVDRKDIKSARKVNDLIVLQERPEGDVERLRQNKRYERAPIFGYDNSTRPDSVRAFDILVGNVLTGYVQFDSVKGDYKESHIIPQESIQTS